MEQKFSLSTESTRVPLSGQLFSPSRSSSRWNSRLPELRGEWGLDSLAMLFEGASAPVIKPPQSEVSRGYSAASSLWPRRVEVQPQRDSRVFTIDAHSKSEREQARLSALRDDGWREGPTIRPLALALTGRFEHSLADILDRIESFGIPVRAVIRASSTELAMTDWVILVRGV